MRRKIFSIFFALVLVCSLGLVTAVPVGADSGTVVSSTDIEGPYVVGVEREFSVTTVSDTGYELVLFEFVVEDTVLDDIANFQFYYPPESPYLPNSWADVPLNEVNGNLEGYFGPPVGFPMVAPYDETTLFRINFDTAKTYEATVNLVELPGETVITTANFTLVVSRHENTIASSTMIFEGVLTGEGGVFTDTIAMTKGEYWAEGGDGELEFIGDPPQGIEQGGFDVYAKEGGTAYVEGVDPGSWTIGSDHDAYSQSGPWGTWYQPDCADWDQYSLELTANHWYLRYTATGESPMSGTMYWYGDGTGYAAETDPGTLKAIHGGSTTDPTEYTAGSAQEWGWHCGWGEERIPLELPGFAVEVTPGGSYEVTLTPAPGPVVNVTTGVTYGTIQLAIDAASSGDTINVAAGEYAGAIVNEDLTIIGAAGGASVITSGVPYKVDVPPYTTAFRLDADADGAEIRNFTINCNPEENFYFAVFARTVDNAIVDSLNISNTIQGISNWGGSGWQITNNVITDTEAAGGGGISIFLGALPGGYPTCSNNLVQYNTITGDGASAETYTCPGICLCLDTRYGAYDQLTGDEEVTGNQILDNTIRVTNVTGGVGIEVDVILGDRETDPDRHDPVKIAALMAAAAIHDNTVRGNTIDGPWQGMLFIHVTDLTVEENKITNCCGEAIVVEGGHAGIAINYNNIYGNGTDPDTLYGGVYNDDTPWGEFPGVDYGSIDARYNWWGDVGGPKTVGAAPPHNPYTNFTRGDAVSDYVDYLPWLIRIDLVTDFDGWNIISLPIMGEEDDSEPPPEEIAIYHFDSSTQNWAFPPYEPGHEPGLLDAVYVKVTAPISFIYPVSSEATFPSSKAMKVGWNLIGLAELHPMPAPMALTSAFFGTGEAGLWGYSQVISPSLNGAYWTYMRDQEVRLGEPLPLLWPMFPTKGYWVFMVNDGVLGGFSSTPIVEGVPLLGPQL